MDPADRDALLAASERLIVAATEMSRLREQCQRIARSCENTEGSVERYMARVDQRLGSLEGAMGIKSETAEAVRKIREASQRVEHQRREPGEQEPHGLVGIFREFRMSRWWTQLIVAGIGLAFLFGPVGVLVAHLIAEKAK